MKFKNIAILAAAILTLLPVSASDEVPRGCVPISELKEAQTKAAAEKKLVVLVVKGMNDDCPNCVEAYDNGMKAVGSGVIKVFTRAENLNTADNSSLPAALQERAKRQFSGGASVSFVVFDPAMSKIICEASRTQLENDKKATSAFKKEVQTAKKSFK